MLKDNAFILPLGMVLGGVTTWSIKMIQKLQEVDTPAILIKHSEPNYERQIPLPSTVKSTSCLGKPAYQARTEDIISYLPTYHSVLPATFIPNWSADTYATCALLNLTQSQDMRVIGFAHTDEDDYYEWLQYYESIIHAFVAVSLDIEAKLKLILPHRVNDIYVRPCAVDVPIELVEKSQTGSPICLMYAGRITNKQKRIYDLLNLIQKLEKAEVDYFFRIVGDGGEKDWLNEQLQSLPNNAQRRVKLENTVPPEQIANLWKESDVCILVSEYEGTSISMLEAMAQGCVPVTTNVSGTAAVIKNGVNGFTVPVGDIEAMSQIIKELADNRESIKEISREAYQTVKTYFSFEDYIPWFQELISTVWEKPPLQWNNERSVFLKKADEPVRKRSLLERLRKLKKLIYTP